MLDKISTVIGLVQNGIELGKIYSNTGAPVSRGKGIEPESKLGASIDYWPKRRRRSTGGASSRACALSPTGKTCALE